MKMVHLSRFVSAVFGFGIAILASTTAAENATTVTAVATLYKVQEPAEGLCRLQDADQTSDNFKYYASVSAKTINDGCARCVEVHRDGSLSVTAYVLDVCKNCKSSEIKLSEEALSQLEFDPESEIRGRVTYKYVSCPTSFASGNVKACLMEGASNTYIPMQFSNTQKVITKVIINGQVATPSNDAFFYSVIAPEADATQSEWYEDIKVTLTWDDGETQSGSFAFSSSDGCATSASQFNTKGENSASGHAVYSAALIMISGCLMMIIDMI
ncbi:hypothetical protein Poli38472_009805 [Pythium oligandrum]|uniref:Expansin-like EG45 domain-containing protein n=1 Tax=Pythium oligandrum TaxID=41045 RepID=A0A8K1FJZ6_PYTOL|nr:hypothetical protein Poli38472_009805 [Pythium oligandrum]|eukprot:TMW62312.1 hypothetical protein Poli38472_009805 [Pythium oligandrum]